MVSGDSFKELSEKELKINYETDDITQKYRDLASRLNINDYLGYTEEIRQKGYFDDEVRTQYSFSGTFHFVLSIKVSDKSDFIPIVFGVGGSNGKATDEVARDVVQKVLSVEEVAKGIQSSNKINYTFLDFVSDVAKMKRERGEKVNDIPRISFVTQIDENDKFSISDKRIIAQKEEGQLWFQPLGKDDTETDFSELLISKGNRVPFAEYMSRVYNEKGGLGISKLYYTIISLDSNFENSGRLSRFMVISSNEKEASFFIVWLIESYHKRRRKSI